MRFLNPIYLITCINKTNEIGDLISDESERKVLAHIESIKQSEFYDEEKLRYKDKIYRVLRAYTKGDGITELVCIGDVNNANSTERN